MSHRPGLELSKQATSKGVLTAAALPIKPGGGKPRGIPVVVSFQFLRRRWSGSSRAGHGGGGPRRDRGGQLLEKPLGLQRPPPRVEEPRWPEAAGRSAGGAAPARPWRPQAPQLRNQLPVTRGNAGKSRTPGWRRSRAPLGRRTEFCFPGAGGAPGSFGAATWVWQAQRCPMQMVRY